jgi:hypothetical protein
MRKKGTRVSGTGKRRKKDNAKEKRPEGDSLPAF